MPTITRAVALLATLAPGVALAHPGHGTVTEPVLHVFAEPAHALPLIAAIGGVAALILVRHVRRRRSLEG